MKVIVPAKSFSSRVPNKNWRAFYEDQSLVDVKLRQLLRSFEPQDIYLSCDDPNKQRQVESYGVNFLLRERKYAEDATRWSEVVTKLVADIPCDDEDDIAWVEVVAPLFADFEGVKETWERVKGDYDCLVTVKEQRQFLLNERGQGVNFNFGHWHCWSQDLAPLYSFEGMAIMKKRDILLFNYVIGRRPFLYPIKGLSVEIDDVYQFELAQRIFADLRP